MWIPTCRHVTSIRSLSVLTIHALVRHTNPTQQDGMGAVLEFIFLTPVKILRGIQIGRWERQVFEIDFRHWWEFEISKWRIWGQ